MRYKIVFVLLVVMATITFAQESSEPITVIGNELMGREENGSPVREVIGHVILHQGNVVITCDRAIQFLAQNNARLIGNVIVTQDTLTIKTPEGFYYGNEKRAYSDKGVILDDKKVILTASIGEYFFKENKAHFTNNVKLDDTSSVLTSDELLYFRKENKAIAMRNVKIVDIDHTIFADSLIHLRQERITYGFNNIKIIAKGDGSTIWGDHIEDYRSKEYSIVDKNPLLMQIDSVYDNSKTKLTSIDTLIIKSKRMEAYRDTTNRFIAYDSVKIVRGDFASRNEITIYERKREKITTYKQTAVSDKPIMWYTNSQLTGDSIIVTLVDKKIDQINVIGKGLVISQNEKYPLRYDQIDGNRLKLWFTDSQLQKTEVFDNVLSFYYMYDSDQPNGLVKASALNAEIDFKDKKIEKVRLFGDPKSEYHPEVLVKGNEKSFVLPRFVLAKGRPVGQELLRTRNVSIQEKKR
jgi:lipopolysaccharide export system protein LptA